MINIFGKYRLSFVLLLLSFFIIPSKAQLSKITFSPQWYPQAQFAGYYVALEKGFYKELGLDVRIIHPSSTTSAFDYLRKGQADLISSFLLDGIKERAKGLPLVNVGQFSQHSALMMVTKKKSGLDKIRDLNNKKLGIWSSGFQDVPDAFRKQNNYNITFVPIMNTINLFLMDGVEALTVMYYNEYDQIINSGINEDELNAFFFKDYGFDVPEDGLYCTEDLYKARKNDLAKFAKATLKGWDYASKNKEYTIDLVVKEMNKAHLPNNKAHQSWMLEKILEMIEPENKNVKKGELLDTDFYKALEIIKSNGDLNIRNLNMRYEDFCKYNPD
jgi:NitT/TauT family transport system substrate-binding protein